MKLYIKYYLLAIISVLSLSSCIDEWLNMPPDDQIVLEQYWKSASDVEATVNACYRYMISDDYLNRLFYYGELRSDNISLENANTDESNLWNANIQTDNNIVKWNAFYQVINYCNSVITYAPEVMKVDANFKEFELRAYLAEALTIRAYSYFYLLRTFGYVPMVLKPSKDDSEDFNIDQNQNDFDIEQTDSVMINQIISDLQLAESYARDKWNSNAETKGRVTKNAVRALLADVYLWNEQYQLCIDACDRLINDKNNEIILTESDYMFNKVFYSGNSPESIFELNFTSNGVKNNMTAILFGNANKNITRGHVKASSSVLYAYDANNDLRAKAYMMSEAQGRKIFKYEGMTVPALIGGNYVYRGSGSSSNWILYRLPEVYLMKAEALAETDNSSNLKQAVMLVNRSYVRANPNSDSLKYENFPTKADVRKLIYAERRREFAFEGKRWFDLLRLSRKEKSTTTALQFLTPGYTDATLITQKLSQFGAWYLPIHQTQMAINKNLEQNAYYRSIFGEN